MAPDRINPARTRTADRPRTPWQLQPADTDQTTALDWNGVALRLLIGLGWGALLTFLADALGIVSGGSIG